MTDDFDFDILELKGHQRVLAAIMDEVPALAGELRAEDCGDTPILIRRLCEIATTPEDVRRQDAITALGTALANSQKHAEVAEPTLIQLLHHENDGIRLAVVEALGRRGLKASPRVVKAMGDQVAQGADAQSR
jgi:HEAT repeat protein